MADFIKHTTKNKKAVAKAPNRADAYKAGVLNDRLNKTKPAKATKEGSPAKKTAGHVQYDAAGALFWESVRKGKLGRGPEADTRFIKAGFKRKGK